MTITVGKHSLSDATRQMTEYLKRLSRDYNPDPVVLPRIHRLEVEIDRIDPLDWLEAQPTTNKTYWRSRDGSYEFAGLGRADIITVHDSPDYTGLQQRMVFRSDSRHPGVRYFGGFRFDPNWPESERDPKWQAFGSARLVLHRFELVADEGRHFLACNLFNNELTPAFIDSVAAETGRFGLDKKPDMMNLPSSSGRQDYPDHDQWIANVNRAVASFKDSACRKLVLARKTSLGFTDRPSQWQLLKGLRETCDNCFLFGLQPDEKTTFIGASPERLYRRDTDRLQTEAVAGTRPRGRDSHTDAELARELTTSEKERREHQLVIAGLKAGLDRVCAEHSVVQETTTLSLPRVQHLITRFAGRLKPGVTDFEIIDSLHPSPAVGGYPVEKASSQLRQYEPFDRGWYAGPVGWIGAEAAEFAVGIRSALLSGNRLDLFSGAGIVKDSEPGAEWDEVESKIGQFLHLTSGIQP